MIPFKSNGHLTLGVEIELQLLHPETLDLNPVAIELFKRTKGNDKIKPEIFQSMAEINTGICVDVHEVEKDLQSTIAAFRQAAQECGALVASTGTHPFARYSERKLYSAERYQKLIDRNQWIARRLMIFGLHVHIGMKSGDDCIRFNNFFLHMVPHMLALSASSPFWQGEDTGLASCRSTIFESCPTAGHPNRMKNWNEFSDLCYNLIKCKAIASYKDLWWDIRPSPDFGTLEIRICDSLATLEENLAMVAFIHALAHWYDTHSDYDADSHAPYMWMMRENKWRAARHGLQADIIANGKAELSPIRQDIENWLKDLGPVIAKLGYERFVENLQKLLLHGTSEMRQRQIYEKTQSFIEVARFNAAELAHGRPLDPSAF